MASGGVVWERPKSSISLHGLGFIQVALGGNQRIHVWHPELPRRDCHRDSAVHNHRFSFTSQVLIGQQINHRMKLTDTVLHRTEEATHMTFLHEGPRSPTGSRPWIPDGPVKMRETGMDSILPGSSYNTAAYEFHWTEPGGDGRVATLMTKTWEGKVGAHSTCKLGVDPHVEFDRYQWSDNRLWEVVNDVLSLGPAD